ncbi:MAG: EAL domain-containing protein [Betaproteobacteria bacterium]|nr:EAL domain-containing protein [Betaproteobacteria bacterium]
MMHGNANNIDAYGAWIEAALEPIKEPMARLSEQFAAAFCDALSSAAHTAEIIGRLSPSEFSELQRRQAQHLIALLDPALTGAEHLAQAERVGRAHALVGVDILWVIEAFSLYQQHLHQLLGPLVPASEQREHVMRVVSRRILLDLAGQVSSLRRVEVETALALSQIDQHVLGAANLADLIRGVLAAIGALDGDVCGFFARADANGQLQIEASFGVAADRYHQAMEAGMIPKISIDPETAAGQGPGGRAWRSGQIVATDAWALEAGPVPWRSIGSQLGFRSSAAVPLLDASGRSIALLSLYSAWPGYFSTLRLSGLLRHVQLVLGHGIEQLKQASVIPLREQQGYRQLLQRQRVVMAYQPIISLRDGRLIKLEALARLQGDDGELIAPLRFLPAFGHAELLQLLEQGLRQACSDCQDLERQGLRTHIAINFPAQGLGDPRYEAVLFKVLDACDLDVDRLQLEVLETQDGDSQTELRQSFVQRLREQGIRFAQDDLGSGHSSLLRMDQYAFDEVKIDQGLVRGALRKPQRALEFIVYLVRLAHAFDTAVTVEGLENLGMIEAAAILGADHGQGYGIARPMPAAEVMAWQRGYRYPVDPQSPRTALGAMAGYLLWDMQMASLADRPALADPVQGARTIVEHFVAANQLADSPLGRLLAARVARSPRGAEGDAFTPVTRLQVIEHLTEYWLDELRR